MTFEEWIRKNSSYNTKYMTSNHEQQLLEAIKWGMKQAQNAPIDTELIKAASALCIEYMSNWSTDSRSISMISSHPELIQMWDDLWRAINKSSTHKR
jgi:hypothetical protein